MCKHGLRYANKRWSNGGGRFFFQYEKFDGEPSPVLPLADNIKAESDEPSSDAAGVTDDMNAASLFSDGRVFDLS